MSQAFVDYTATWKRSTSKILDAQTAAASLTPTRQPVGEACMQVTAATAGTVTVSGTADGVSDTEVLTFAAAGVKSTLRTWTAITSFACTVTGTVSAEAVGRDGQPQEALYNLKVGHPVGVTRKGMRTWGTPAQGSTSEETTTIRVMYEEVWSPRAGDIVELTDGTIYEVQGAPWFGGGLWGREWRCKALQRQAHG